MVRHQPIYSRIPQSIETNALLLRALALQPRPGLYPGDSGRFFKLDALSDFLVTQPAPGILMREHLA